MSVRRSKLGLLVVLGLLLVAAAPLWHGDHQHAAGAPPYDRGDQRPQLWDPRHAEPPAGPCLVCLSHRLLNHVSPAIVATVVAPSSFEAFTPGDLPFVVAPEFGCSGARAPPLDRA